MKISIIIISWNVRDLLRQCLNSIYQNKGDLELEIFVVDNASADGSAEMVAQEFSQINLIANDKNFGFAKANNQAIAAATGDYVLLLNPDTQLLPNTLNKCLEFMNQHQDGGVMGCQILNSDQSIQPSVRRFPTFWPIFLMLVKAPKIFKNLKSINNYLAIDFDYSKIQEIDQIMGAFMFIKKEVFKKIGLLDESFFIWFEEVDFCQRCWQGGFKVYYNPQAQIIHHGGQSFNQQKTINKQCRFFKSAGQYFLKNGFTNNKRK